MNRYVYLLISEAICVRFSAVKILYYTIFILGFLAKREYFLRIA
jgi:hypothetical protein